MAQLVVLPPHTLHRASRTGTQRRPFAHARREPVRRPRRAAAFRRPRLTATEFSKQEFQISSENSLSTVAAALRPAVAAAAAAASAAEAPRSQIAIRLRPIESHARLQVGAAPSAREIAHSFLQLAPASRVNTEFM